MDNIKQLVSEKLKQLEEAETTYKWEAEEKVNKSDYKLFYTLTGFLAIIITIVIIMAIFVNVSLGNALLNNILGLVIISTLVSLFFSYGLYVSILIKPSYKFELTRYGIRGIESSNVAEFWHHLGKVIVWGGMIACIVILFVAGPMAFAGAGGSALLVFSLRNQMGREKPITILFGSEIKIEHERKTKDISINDCRYREYGDYYKYFKGFIYYEEKQYKEILAEIDKLGTKIYYPALRNRQKKQSQ
ncbi:hypothetical protein [Thaumasiovibrio subtropicus]|uniref:hypothetical protein n=2 Tax=Thaumasiovibrio subtropicus TaxID=1891207 RepID=UPI001C855E19|nr:hypothetical protein [Thaumasiovibrio subtropicus]